MRNPSGRPGSGTPSSVSSPSTNVRRRRFLLSLGAGGAGVAAAVASTSPVASVLPVPPATSEAPSGYRETKHVRDYYRTAKV